MISVFDLFKIGIGPSSSHTVGPMAAAARFRAGLGPATAQVRAEIFGSLAWTGRGHGTDIAISLGLLGESPATVDPDAVAGLVAGLTATRRIPIPGSARGAAFDPRTDLVFNFTEILPRHTNGMRFRAYDAGGACLDEAVLYSIGGGFVVGAEQGTESLLAEAALPFGSGAELLDLCARTGLSVPQVQLANELTRRGRPEIEAGLDAIRDAMFACIERGLRQDGELPGGLKVRRRAKRLYEALDGSRLANDRPAHEIMDWISLFALAVNEENASGGRVVTAPTNGAAGIVPAVLRYCRDFCPGWSDARGRDFLLTAAAIGGLIKRRASISGAEVGCQGEVGSAASMAAAGLAAALGATAGQIENAAEIAMEHHLGMTCDPIGGLVQIPCIERNAFGANKAIVAASLALRGDGLHRVSLDEVIETMRQTGADMQSKYKETALGGLAVNVAAC
ncbi:L-serine ammonia-lyase [Methylobacterium planeticum]|uniref:L-serine dehydratase n=1 Tax=Methylobacterium planeticum TaxID=2615211 RepID=A0A6N6MHJ2_9HYPH|nr:L-serine ammonia-lyase [Methylobacterium planeticum]KAB1070461.1 L-serine ammonia-lyase [Methylobacterium planeticum]